MALALSYSCRCFAVHAADHLSLVEGGTFGQVPFQEEALIWKPLSFLSVESVDEGL